MLLGTNFDDLKEENIQSLVNNRVPESVHLEFKKGTYGKADKDKKELRKDVSAFANTFGGHLLIGVDEKNGVASAVVPLSGDTDKELQRLESIVRDRVEPKIVDLRMRRIDVKGGSVIVIHVPRSSNPPHRITRENSTHYYARNSGGVYELSLEELRMLFGERRDLEARAKSFIGERFLRLQSNDGAVPMAPGKLLVMHLVPLPDFGANRQIELPDIQKQSGNFPVLMISCQGKEGRINEDGLCFLSTKPPKHEQKCYEAYTQVFRNGSLEVASAEILEPDIEWNKFSTPLDTEILPGINRVLSSCMKGLRALEVSPPFLLQISATGVAGLKVHVGERKYAVHGRYDREELHLPHGMITEYDDDDNYEPIVTEQMDFFRNAFGIDSVKKQ